jgi:AcrR family transcriptional regulator
MPLGPDCNEVVPCGGLRKEPGSERGGAMQIAHWAMAGNGSPERAARGRSPGRPRDITLDTAISRAAARHLAERGFAGMSIEGVAAAAGTTPPSLRRRFRTKLQLAMAGINAIRREPLPEPTGDPRADALAILGSLRGNLARRNGMAVLGTILAEERRNPELLEQFRRRLDEPLRERLREALALGIQSGRLRPGLDIDAAVSLLIGSLYAQYVQTQQIPDEWAERTLSVIWPAGEAAS